MQEDPERRAMVDYVVERGATPAEAAATDNLGELALDLHLRPRSARTFGEVAAATGADWPRAERLLRACGLTTDPSAHATATEAATLELLVAVADSVLGDAATLQLARVSGNAMARVAESLVTAFRLRLELPHQAAGTPYVDVVHEYTALAEQLLPPFLGMLDAIVRRQIVAVAERMWTTDDERSTVTLPRAIGFADLVGYTAAVSAMTVRELSDALVEFEEVTSDVVARAGGQLVKTIGDEAMFATEDPGDACAIALELVSRFGTGALPPVRVGLAAGDVVTLSGDLYGPDVNLAARLVALAEPSGVVVSASVRDACADRFAFSALGPLAVKGFPEPVNAFRLLPA